MAICSTLTTTAGRWIAVLNVDFLRVLVILAKIEGIESLSHSRDCDTATFPIDTVLMAGILNVLAWLSCNTQLNADNAASALVSKTTGY